VTGPRLALAVALVAGLIPVAGCAADSTGREGVIVTSQPLLDAFDRLGEPEHVVGYPDWAIVDEPREATRVGEPFSITTEQVVRVGPKAVLDQPHPLVSGPSREALATGLDQADIRHEQVPTDPRLSTVRALLDEAAAVAETDPGPVFERIQANLDQLNATLTDQPTPNALFLFPAGLTAGNETDVNRIFELAGVDNAAAEAGLTGYQQITGEAVQRVGVDYVVAAGTMRATPTEIAGRPMFEDTEIEDDPDRVLVVDPSRTTRLGPYVDQAARWLAHATHPELPGPELAPEVEPMQASACSTITVAENATDATVTIAGQSHPVGEIELPAIPNGHYRLHVDAPNAPTFSSLVTVEGSECAS
jgi:ABC-type hemin transport system substrate-binding protein